MRMRVLAIFGVVSLVLGAACASAAAPGRQQTAGAPSSEAVSSGASADSAAKPATAQRAAAPAAAPAPANAPADQGRLPELDRMIIRTVNMTIGVGNVQEVYRQAERIAAEQGGFVAGSQIRQDGDRTTATLTLRVPADGAAYQTTLERLRGIADKVIDEQSQAQDVTEEFVDLDSRLRNLRATEDSLLALLAKAQRMEDIIAIQRELTTVRGQIEQIQGRKQALERRSAMATINLQIRELATFARGGWAPGETFAEALRALGQAVQALATFLIWAIVWSPLWGGALALLWLLRRFLRAPRLNLDRRPAPAAAPPPAGAAS